MSEPTDPDWPPQGPPRVAGVRAVRPRDAATLIIVRRDAAKPRVLMGRRNAGHSFMPNLWVFPGGRIDRADFRAPGATDLRPEVAATFDAHLKPGRGRALACAAVRETFEETGLILGRPAAADLEAIDILARAVTPPGIAKRFDTWFLMADAERLLSLERQPDCGELEEVAWVDFDDARALPLPTVTRHMMGELAARLADPGRPRPYLRRDQRGWAPRYL
jgi:8-oxo-dGTP pyrophosphatase MutT (NUDIX family)